MEQVIATRTEANQRISYRADHWNGRTPSKSTGPFGPGTLNVRAVEFIAKPHKMGELQECMRGRISEFLGNLAGFSGALVLTSHKEPRLILVLSFWNTEGHATQNRWEDSRVVRQMVSPLIDVCSRVHTYEAAVPVSPKMSVQITDLHTC